MVLKTALFTLAKCVAPLRRTLAHLGPHQCSGDASLDKSDDEIALKDSLSMTSAVVVLMAESPGKIHLA